MSTYDMLVVLPPMPPERYREAATAALMPYYSELEVPEYRDYEAADPNSVDWVQANKERGILPNREDLGWNEIATLMNAQVERAPGDDGYMYVDEAEHGYYLATYNPQGEWDGLRLRLGGPRLMHRPDAAGNPLLAFTTTARSLRTATF
ncbi:hypothetical protein ACFQ2M_42340 [Kitasatospora saccharophila]|uniref:hypothetical protein n=1 Tax=Kitasatospora saccharophila TaxID=407973 RepID=UPI0036412920